MRIFALVLAIAVSSMPAHAGIVWDESVGGDLPLGGVDLGNFDIGTNTVIGSFGLFRESGGAARADTDNGFFSIADGLAVVDMTYTITGVRGFGVVSWTRNAGLDSPSGDRVYEEYLNKDGTTLLLTDLLPSAQAGQYKFFGGGGSASVQDDVEFYWDYRLDFQVGRVPAPTPFGLIALMFGVLIFRSLVNHRSISAL